MKATRALERPWGLEPEDLALMFEFRYLLYDSFDIYLNSLIFHFTFKIGIIVTAALKVLE